MAKEVLTDVKITVNGTDLSDHTSSVTLEDTAEEVEFTAFGAGYRDFGQGLKDATITATMFNDHASGSVADTIQALYSSGEAGTIKVWPKSSGTVVYTMVGRVFSKPSLAGAVGDASAVDVVFRNGGTAGVTRGTL